MIPLPNEFVQAIEEMLGCEAPAFFASLDEPPTLALRLNPFRKDAPAVSEEFTDGPVPWAKDGRYLRAGARPGAGIAHAAGAFYLQEASAMVSAAILDAQPGERVLDLCAAPGGKSTQIAASLGGEGLLISNEPEPARAKVLAANLERMGVRNAAVTNAYPDALAERWPEYFDALLCDAPCSGEGMFRREPDARAEWKSTSPAGCAKRQAEILDRAAELVRPGGRLVYSTCTFNRNENEETIAAFLARHPEFEPEDFELPGVGASVNGCIRIWPHRQRGDGHFAAKLRKAGSGKRREAPAIRIDRECAALIGQLEKEVCALPKELKARVVRLGDYLYAIPAECPDTKGLKLASAGLCLLRVGKNYIEPAHALAMALDASLVRQKLELDDNQARRYLAGEALDCEKLKGWTWICWHGMPLGWGKASNGQMKNHLPKGLRLSLHP